MNKVLDTALRTAPQAFPPAAAMAEDAGPMQQRVYAQIRAMLEDGRIRPGERLLEVHVAKAFGVSRSPARRALEGLCRDKLVREAPGRGYIAVGRRSDRAGGELAVLPEAIVEPVARWKQVYAEMEQQICIGVVAHSLRIIEDRVATHFNVSRTVARDALARLEGEGLVAKDRQGWLAERLTAGRLRALYELRWLLEPTALVQSAPQLDPAQIRAWREKLVVALGDMPALGSATHIALENDMHVLMLAGCANKELLRVLVRTHSLLVSNPYRLNFGVDSPREHMRASLTQHLEVMDAVLASDLPQASAALHRHLVESCEFWLRNWDQVEAEPTPPLPPYLAKLES